MAILTKELRARVAAGIGAAAVSLLGGCMLVQALVQDEPHPFAFPHATHVEDEGLECKDCHASWEDSDDPGMPLAAQCALCHDDLDKEKPADRQVAALFDGDRFRAAHAERQSEEIRFSHRAHATRGIECTTCHAAVAADDGRIAQRGNELRLSMEDCLRCHAERGGPGQDDCSACHVTISNTSPPPSHRAEWRRFHGSVVRARSDQRMDRCSLCHKPDDCTTCHSIEMPANHDNYWRRRAHGLVASMDRESCATCHDPDSCRRCHEETRPLSHVGSWGEPRDRHCLTCHEPLREDSCVACHASTPSHETATPLPPDHLPGMNCRLCHGNGQPLPHVDNGQTCTSCHH